MVTESRIERLIKAISENAGTSDVISTSRVEKYLFAILLGKVSTMPPKSRWEAYLAAISGASVDVPEPVTAADKFLAKLAGMDVETPEPVTRLEKLLAEWVHEHEQGQS